MKQIRTSGLRSSHFGGRSGQNRFSRPQANRFSRPNNNGRSFGTRSGGAKGGAHRSELEGRDINIFINRARELDAPVAVTNINNFEDFAVHPELMANIKHKGYTKPTPIQDQAIKHILEGRDLIGLASTGTGKTAAFLIPLINKILLDRNERVLIIAPTRELALQIDEELYILTYGMKIHSTLLIGGANMNTQINNIRRDPSFVIATPGRLKDLIERRVLYLDNFGTFVLDEVDRMVDIGFIQDIKYFISLLPAKRQSLFFSATIAPKVQEILKDFVQDPITISIKKQETSENVEQDVIRVRDRSQKIEHLHDLLNKTGFDKVLIFGRTKHGIEKLNRELTSRGFKADAIHGNKSQSQRQRALDSFKKNQIKILLATDVASRGLDIDNVTHVINYDLPQTYEDYIHRIGRTGRADKRGTALTFVE